MIALLLVALAALFGLVFCPDRRHELAMIRLRRRVAAMRFRFSASDMLTMQFDEGPVDPLGDPLLAHLPPDVLARVVRRRDRNRPRSKFGRDVNLAHGGGMPTAAHFFWYGFRARVRAAAGDTIKA